MLKIDLRSDTVTMPTPAMLESMMHASVGDDVFGEDPTVNALERHVAQIFGKEAGIFCPSGTMTNQIGIRLHTNPGSEVICHRESHVYRYEAGGIAVNSLASVRLLEGDRGRLVASDVAANINLEQDIHLPVTTLVCLEDTTNRGGGAVYKFSEIEKIKEVCVQNKLALHLDGARLFNALVETRQDYKQYAAPFDTMSICLSKGLGAPVGSVLIGTSEHIRRARRFRKVMGGAMRQAGFLAAAGLYALHHHVERLKDDHRRARAIAASLADQPYIDDLIPVETNIVIFHLNPSMPVPRFVDRLKELGVLAMPFGPHSVRMVTHLGITDHAVEKVSDALQKIR